MHSEDTREGRLRIKMMQELAETEETYVTSLETTMKNYYEPLKSSGLISEPDLEVVFGDLEIIADLSKNILNKILARVKQWYSLSTINNLIIFRPRVQKMGDILSAQAPAMKLYYRYIRSYNKAVGQLSELRAQNPKLNDFLNSQQKITTLPLESFLIMPGNLFFSVGSHAY